MVEDRSGEREENVSGNVERIERERRGGRSKVTQREREKRNWRESGGRVHQ